MTSLKTSTTSKAAMAIVVAAISITIFAPSAYAAGPDRQGRDGGQMQAHRDGGDMQANRQGGMMGGRGGQLLALGCGPNAAERIETGLVRLGYRVDATAEQKTLLDSLKTASLAAQAELATVCAEVMPAPATADAAAPADAPAADAATRPDLLTRLQGRLKVEEARLAAMTEVLPQFEAFYNSLTAEQKSALEPKGDRDGRGPGRDRGHDGRPHDIRNN
jgi:hypothetical protein